MIKVGIVGAEEKYWLHIPYYREKIAVKVETILRQEALKGFNFDRINAFENITLVSGGCAVSICDNCHHTGFSKINDPITGYVKCEVCNHESKRRAGGVDIIAEQVADKLNINKTIFPPQIEQYTNLTPLPWTSIVKEYFVRNNKVAKDCTILFDIEPVIAKGGALTVEDYNKILGKYNNHGKPKFKLDIETSTIGGTSGVPLKIDGDWLLYDDGWGVNIASIKSWRAIYTSGGYYALNAALKLRKSKSRMVPIE